MSAEPKGRLIQRWPIGSGYVAIAYEGDYLDAEVLDLFAALTAEVERHLNPPGEAT